MQLLIDRAERRQTEKIQGSIDELKRDLTSRLNGADKAIKKLQSDMKQANKKISEANNRAKEREESLEAKVKELVAASLEPAALNAQGKRPRPLYSQVGGQQPVPDNNTASLDPRQESYWTARKSLKLSPIPPGEDSLKVGVANFLLSKLKVKREEIVEMVYDCERVPERPKKKGADKQPDVNEVLVTFKTQRTRDYVRSHAKNLGKDANLRLEIPPFLRGDFSTLQDLGHRLKNSNEFCRRNIKFDDANLSLLMDFCVDEETWKTVTVEEAKNYLKTRTKKRVNSITSNDLVNLIDPSDEEMDDDQ